jgi:hypothetical protein
MDSSDDSFLRKSISPWHFCRFCKHFHNPSEKFTCDAFPDGIPRELHSGLLFHGKPLPGQKNSIVFKSKYKTREQILSKNK